MGLKDVFAGGAAFKSGKIFTVTVWDSIEATEPTREGTAIPRSFVLKAGGETVQVHGNATEHLAGYAAGMARRGLSPEAVNLASEVQLSNLQLTVTRAIANGAPLNTLVKTGGWGLKFSQ
ncbi:hemagglutinin [Chitinimonas arctica]|uniref:Hemagglutinin n=1 Tax=Chitinimonas arctica TaxID=2594795 RepID=A0A516SCL7_9NEIS|nr:hemagglutinin [Chitinimonas arctica]QDQ25892.1 hemagglutinin [Chitinimonas arctica]